MSYLYDGETAILNLQNDSGSDDGSPMADDDVDADLEDEDLGEEDAAEGDEDLE